MYMWRQRALFAESEMQTRLVHETCPPLAALFRTTRAEWVKGSGHEVQRGSGVWVGREGLIERWKFHLPRSALAPGWAPHQKHAVFTLPTDDEDRIKRFLNQLLFAFSLNRCYSLFFFIFSLSFFLIISLSSFLFVSFSSLPYSLYFMHETGGSRSETEKWSSNLVLHLCIELNC
jgi:hypothetical protein